MFVYLLLCVCVCVCVCGLGWRGRSLLPSAQWLMEINVWFAGYLIKDLMLKHAPALSCSAHSKENCLIESICSFCLHSSLCLQSGGICLWSCMVAITWQTLCPLTADCQYMRLCMCVCVCVCVCVQCPECCITPSPPPRCSPLSVCAYRPDAGMEKRLPSTQNQWLLFSLLQRPLVICNEYKAHIVARETHTLIHLIFTSTLLSAAAAAAGVTYKLPGDWG